MRCTLSEFSNKLVKQQKHLIFCLGHISLYSESAAWLPDLCLDRNETDKNRKAPPTVILCHTLSRVWSSRLWARSSKNEIQGYIGRPYFSVHLHFEVSATQWASEGYIRVFENALCSTVKENGWCLPISGVISTLPVCGFLAATRAPSEFCHRAEIDDRFIYIFFMRMIALLSLDVSSLFRSNMQG